MTNSEQALREFAEKQHPENWELAAQSLFNQIQRSSQAKCLSDLTALISEHYYPKEFTEWVAKMIDIGDLWESQMEEGWILFPDPKGVRKRFKTTDELFNYWKENVR